MREETVNILKTVSKEVTNMPFDMVGKFYIEEHEVKVERLLGDLNNAEAWDGDLIHDIDNIRIDKGKHNYRFTFYTQDELGLVQHVEYVLDDKDIFKNLLSIYNQLEYV